MNGARTGNFFLAPPPGALGRGQKVKYHFLISITKSILKIFYNKLCVFSQMKDTKLIRRDFYSIAWVMPFGWNLGCLGVKNQILSCCLSVMLSPPKPFDGI